MKNVEEGSLAGAVTSHEESMTTDGARDVKVDLYVMGGRQVNVMLSPTA